MQDFSVSLNGNFDEYLGIPPGETLAETIVLTSNERLRRTLIRAYNQSMVHKGERAWLAARIFSIDAWLGQQYELARTTHVGLPRLLDAGSELLLWSTTAPSGQENLAPLARDAWRLCWQWKIPIDEYALRKTENGRLFHDWAERFSARLQALNAITRPELATRLTRLPAPSPERVLRFALESPTSGLDDYLSHLTAGGWQVASRDAPLREASDCVRVSFQDPRQELSAAAQWCRQVLLRNPEASVGIVVPDLDQRYHAVSRQFSAWLQSPDEPGATKLFDIAGGTPLGEQPIWQAASHWLRFCFGQLTAEQFRRMQQSPYLELPPLPSLPSTLPETFGVAELYRVSDDTFWRAIFRERPDPAKQIGLSAWIERFQHLLALGGWTGQGARSGQFQAYELLTALLQATRRDPVFPRRCTAPEALEALGRIIDDRLFAPEQPPARVQILGYLETTGLSFSHLWVLGMQDTDWPRGVSPTPLVPLSTQLEQQVPRVSPDAELAFAERRIRQWRGSGGQVVFSHATTVEGVSHGISPLLERLPTAAPEALVEGLISASHPALIQRNVALEPRPDPCGSPVDEGLIRGGSNLLKDQAHCPFRAWAIHRLGVSAPREPHAYPDALDRGQLLHDLMQFLLERDHGSRAHPRDLDDALVSSAIDRALQRTYRRFPDAYVDAERLRLHELVKQWQAQELARTDYRVEAVEQSVELQLAGLTLNLRLDRLDRLLDSEPDRASENLGDLLVLDYKTGRVQPKHLLEDRLLEPQLPLYAIANPAIKGVLYVQMTDRDVRATGIGAEHLNLSPARTLTPPDGDWEGLRTRWQNQLTGLGEEFRRGIAVVLPATVDTCRYCHLQTFCRIGEGSSRHPDSETVTEDSE